MLESSPSQANDRAQNGSALLSDRAYALLRERLLSGRFAPGQRLDVAELSRQMGISQTPIKEALAVLSQDGLIEVRARSGTFVAQLDLREMLEAFDIRMSLELLAAETLLDHVTSADVRALQALARTIQATTTIERHYAENARFHQMLVDLSGNRRLSALYGQLHAHVHLALVHVVAPGWWRDTPTEAREHAAIVAAIRERDRRSLKAAIRAHLERSRATLKGQLESRNGRHAAPAFESIKPAPTSRRRSPKS